MTTSRPTPDWKPFALATQDQHGEAPRAINSKLGVGDRLRAAAFAELQAREAFNWAAETFQDAPDSLRAAWRELAIAEDRHLGWLLTRLAELDLKVEDRRVSDHLWHSFQVCKTAREFAKYMASAEERGRRAGERFAKDMEAHDPVSAKIFGTIALEEIAHIELATRYFPELPNPLEPRSVESSSETSLTEGVATGKIIS